MSWISCEEKYPESKGFYMIYWPIETEAANNHYVDFFDGERFFVYHKNATHWQELPSPPPKEG